MKISIVVLSLVASTVSASSLRKSESNTKNIQSKVILKGIGADPTDADMDFIGKALIASYNNIHWEVGHFMTGDHSTEFVGNNCMYW
jgi:isocitrate dehydrogenase